MKKFVRFLFSMKFAIILLLLLIAACVAGSLIPQGYVLSYYTQQYSTTLAGAIMLFGLNDVFHAPWFVVLTIVLCLNLLGCNLIRFPRLYRQMKEGWSAQKAVTGWHGEGADGVCRDAEQAIRSLGFRTVECLTLPVGRTPANNTEINVGEKQLCTAATATYLYAVRNKAGVWGAWLTHLGMLLVIAGFGFGQMAKQEYTVYGVPGQTKAIGDSDYELTIDDFETVLREDGSVEQYTSTLTVTDTATGETVTGTSSVNAPLNAFGMKLYQNSTGWAATAIVFTDEELLQQEVLCVGEAMQPEVLPNVTLLLSNLYPDYAEDDLGEPQTLSNELNNPAYLYQLYYGDQVLGMNVLTGNEVITLDDYLIRFINPTAYTLIQVKRDPYTPLAAAGALIMVLGLLLAFYLRTASVRALQRPDGTWYLSGRSPKGGREFRDQVKAACDVYKEENAR